MIDRTLDLSIEVPPHGDLGHLERDIATMTDFFGSVLVSTNSSHSVVSDRLSISSVTVEQQRRLVEAIFAEVEDLRKVANQALQEAIDQVLDDPLQIPLMMLWTAPASGVAMCQSAAALAER